MPLLIGLLVVTFTIAADLAHEAWSTAVAQQQTAERAGRDFVRFTATSASYEARAAIDLGLRTLFAPVTSAGASRPATELLVRSADHVRECRCAPRFTPRYYFSLRLSDTTVQLRGDSLPSPNESRWLRDTVRAHVHLVRRADWEDALLYGSVDGARRVVAYAVRGDGANTEASGFVSDVSAFGDAIFAGRLRPRRDVELAPQSARYDSLMRTLILAPAPDREAIYDVNPRRAELRVTMVPRAGHESYAPGVAPVAPVVLFADTIALGARYGDLRLDVALASNEPGDLFADGVPRSRLLALFGLLVLMGGLVVAVVVQLRREHELARLRADLTAGVSHELRTPLAQILLFGETLMFERTRSERERRAAAEVIVREARRLMHLVENALHFTRVDRHLLEPSEEVIDLAVATRETLVSFAPLAWAAKVTLKEVIDEPAPALIDAAAYRQIMLNLLENAVRYGPQGQTVTVRVERGTDRTRLIVEDEGPGVPMADRERIWEPFVRLTSGRRGANGAGTGIGLAVVRDLTRRHGGRAWVEGGERDAGPGLRDAGGGARFIVELPSGIDARKESGQPGGPASTRVAL